MVWRFFENFIAPKVKQKEDTRYNTKCTCHRRPYAPRAAGVDVIDGVMTPLEGGVKPAGRDGRGDGDDNEEEDG